MKRNNMYAFVTLSILSSMLIVACGEKSTKTKTAGGNKGDATATKNDGAQSGKQQLVEGGIVEISGAIVKGTSTISEVTVSTNNKKNIIHAKLKADAVKGLDSIKANDTIYTENCTDSDLDAIRENLNFKKVEATGDNNIRTVKASVIMLCGMFEPKASRLNYISDRLILADLDMKAKGLANTKLSFVTNDLILKSHGDNSNKISVIANENEKPSESNSVIEMHVKKSLDTSKEKGKLILISARIDEKVEPRNPDGTIARGDVKSGSGASSDDKDKKTVEQLAQEQDEKQKKIEEEKAKKLKAEQSE